jgi:hypothetical protein
MRRGNITGQKLLLVQGRIRKGPQTMICLSISGAARGADADSGASIDSTAAAGRPTRPQIFGALARDSPQLQCGSGSPFVTLRNI